MPDHWCTERTIDWSQVTAGFLRCEDCGRTWTLTPDGWVPNPKEKAPPR